MFSNIGKKIKILAYVIACGGSSLLVLSGIGNIINGLDMIYLDSSTLAFGIFSIIFGPVISYAFSLLTYGFGQLIENTASFNQRDDEEKS